MSYSKTRNSNYNKLLTRTYLETLFSIYDQQLAFFKKIKKKQFCLTEYIRQSYKCTGVLHTRKKKIKKKEKKRKSKKYHKLKSTGDELNVGYDKVNFPVGV